MFRCVVLDFDGTFTDITREAEPFEPVMIDSVSDLLGRDAQPEWNEARATILRTPEQFGWVYDGKVVAPATADPYLLCTATLQAVLDRSGTLKNPALRTEITQALYGLAYAQTVTAFRPGAREVLDHVLESGAAVFVVTNSKTDAVAKKLETLGVGGGRKLTTRGEAKKFWIVDPEPNDETFSAIPDVVDVPELPRPVYLRRGKYYEALRKIWTETATTPRDTLVCGDIFELDLALPAALGAHVVLVERNNTLPYERAATERASGRVIPDLRELITLVK